LIDNFKQSRVLVTT